MTDKPTQSGTPEDRPQAPVLPQREPTEPVADDAGRPETSANAQTVEPAAEAERPAEPVEAAEPEARPDEPVKLDPSEDVVAATDAADDSSGRDDADEAAQTVVPVAARGDGGGPVAAWRRIREGLQPSRGQAIVGVVLGLVAFLAVVQVRQNLADDGYANARREDLIEILDGLGQSTRRLESEITELEARKTKLSSGADRAENARTQAEQQIKVLGILAGTIAAQGPGVRITLTDPNGKIESGNLLDAIEELRDAGAEAIQINGKVRVVASTDFTDDPPGIRIDDELLQAPYVIEAIGDSHNLAEAANFPGGLVSEITGAQINGTAEVKELQTVRITALHRPQEHRYARPAASPTK